MKRLTKRINSMLGKEVVCYIGQHKSNNEEVAAELSSTSVRELLARLAAYEDTGMEPEEIALLKKSCGLQAAAMQGMSDIWNAQKDGRLLVLPCKVGTAVYRLDFNQHDGCWIEPHFFRLQDLEHVGKTIFLTKEAADAEIRRLEHG